jgi:inner membrane protein
MLIAAGAGFATHGLLDACTSYGTQLLWPFSDARISWDLIFILDPLYSLILLAGLVVSLRKGLGNAALIALLLSTSYLGLGALQHGRALALQQELAARRGHEIRLGRVIPAPGPHLLWRSIYLAHGELHVDALRVGYGRSRRFWAGGALPYFSSGEIAAQIPRPSVLARDLGVFEWFTEGYVARLGREPLDLGDLRFSALPDGLQPLWGIRVDLSNPERHVQRLRFPWGGEARFDRLWEMLRDRAPGGASPAQANANKWLKPGPAEAMLAPTRSLD